MSSQKTNKWTYQERKDFSGCTKLAADVTKVHKKETRNFKEELRNFNTKSKIKENIMTSDKMICNYRNNTVNESILKSLSDIMSNSRILLEAAKVYPTIDQQANKAETAWSVDLERVKNKQHESWKGK